MEESLSKESSSFGYSDRTHDGNFCKHNEFRRMSLALAIVSVTLVIEETIEKEREKGERISERIISRAPFGSS